MSRNPHIYLVLLLALLFVFNRITTLKLIHNYSGQRYSKELLPHIQGNAELVLVVWFLFISILPEKPFWVDLEDQDKCKCFDS